jgi:hypothetical protein
MMKSKLILSMVLIGCLTFSAIAQPDRWQQKAKYEMNIDMNVENHRFAGTQKLTYYNNSPDVLDKVFYHLYFNAFQPNSMMDVRSRTIADPDKRVGDRISSLKPNEIGYLKVEKLKQNGKKLKFETVGTILEVQLKKPIQPGESVVFEMEFEGQVPMQIRRSGRDNKEGISYSMAQWYPKMCEYDYQGWHANPYVGREFYGIWGDFDVKITLDKKYTIGGTGYLQNPQEIGHGYEDKSKPLNVPNTDKLTWHFVAPNVHDFMWAADPDYKHVTAQVPNGPMLHFFYQENDKTKEWEKLPAYAIKAFQFISKHYGKYPYEQYSIIQGGDGGMEYPMGTLITGHRKLASLVGVTVHEGLHSWYQMIMGSNESLYSWMDEGFTSYASSETMAHLFDRANKDESVHNGSYQGYRYLAKSGKEEPMRTHSDHYSTNLAYGLASYSKGAVFLHQLEYIIGEKAFDKGMLDYFDNWKFKHPNPNDFIRIMEKSSGLELDWYKEYWVNTTSTIDYAIVGMEAVGNKTKIKLKRIGKMPMPIDVSIMYGKNKVKTFNMPLQIMRGEKPAEGKKWSVESDWAWTHPTYELIVPIKMDKIKTVMIDPSGRLADVELNNNIWKTPEKAEEKKEVEKKED